MKEQHKDPQTVDLASARTSVESESTPSASIGAPWAAHWLLRRTGPVGVASL